MLECKSLSGGTENCNRCRLSWIQTRIALQASQASEGSGSRPVERFAQVASDRGHAVGFVNARHLSTVDEGAYLPTIVQVLIALDRDLKRNGCDLRSLRGRLERYRQLPATSSGSSLELRTSLRSARSSRLVSWRFGLGRLFFR